MAYPERSRLSAGGGVGGSGSGAPGSGSSRRCGGGRGRVGGVGGEGWSLLRVSCSPQLVCLLYLLLVLYPLPCRPVTDTTSRGNVTTGANREGESESVGSGTANHLLDGEKNKEEVATKEMEDPAITQGQPMDDDAGAKLPPPALTPTPTPAKPPTSTTARNNDKVLHSTKVIIETKQGRMGGTAVNVDNEVTTRFLGVPYAAAPVGELRFKPPQKHSWKQEKGWSFRSIWNATKVKPACPRDLTAWRYPFSLDKLYGDMVSKVETSEDCLYLNIFVPRNLSSLEHINTLALPVMIYLHDGHLRTEHSILRNAWRFARDGHVIVATVSFRVDVLGYFSLMEADAEGNFGLRDQTLALHWIWDNIREFGGDPDKITIFGSGHGGIDVGYHVLSQQSRGLFVRAISQSGSVLSKCCRQKDPIGAANSLARNLNCPVSPHSDMMKCLRKAPLGHLMTASQKTAKQLGQWWPVVDGKFITDDPLKLLEAGNFNPVDYIIGANSHDGYETIKDMHIDLDRDISNDGLEDLVLHFVKKYFTTNIEQVTRAILTEYHFCALNVTQLGQSLVGFLTDMDYFAPAELAARYLSRNVNRRVFLYEFAHRPSYASGARPPFIAAHHLDDLEYVTGDVRYVIRNVTQAERQLSQALMSAWTNFARTG